MKIAWSTDFIVVDGERPALDELRRIDAASAKWVVVRIGAGYRCVLSRDELFERLRRTRVPYHPACANTLAEVLDLHETQSSTSITDSSQLAPPDLSWRPDETAPSVRRHVELDAASGKVLAVGGADVARQRKTRSMRRIGAPMPQMRQPPTAGDAPPDSAPPPAAAAPADDEGTTPVRHPSIEPEAALAPGAPLTLVIDLLREPSAATAGAALALGEQAADWSTLPLGVTLVSAAIDFDQRGRGKVTIRRNDTSIPARIGGRVHDDVAAGTEIEVHAQFWTGARCCGSAVRVLVVGAAGAAAAPASPQATVGEIRAERAAEAPDLTVYIALIDRNAPGSMHWRMEVAEEFDGLPPQLDGFIDLGGDPRAEAAAMFKQFANLERGKHRARLEGFGERLWDRAPAEFRAVYWALHDHYRRALVIQFISDDPHLPWELMRPFRDGETHEPLALRHAVARWIGRWRGYMRNQLGAGGIVAIAPKYKSASARLSLAEATAGELVAKLGARAVNGTLAALHELLEAPPDEPVALLYFTGHGVFSADAASASAIKLEDGNLAVDEVARREVRLGERHGTLVFLNACEVGATASALGTVGGWADAFLSRRFRGFIAPLWAIDEEDAAQVTHELMAKIVTERMPIAAALRDLRAKHGDVSPTFFSYLLYGDVTARLGARG